LVVTPAAIEHLQVEFIDENGGGRAVLFAKAAPETKLAACREARFTNTDSAAPPLDAFEVRP